MTASPPPECPRCGRAECAALNAVERTADGQARWETVACDGEPVDWRAKAKAAESERAHADMLAEALDGYGGHHVTCPALVWAEGLEPMPDCDCGFGAALAAHAERRKK